MLATSLIIFALSALTSSQLVSPTVVCIPGQCLQGYSNTTMGATLSAPGGTTSIHLLPGQYASNTNPQLLHDMLTASSASLSPSPGFNASLSLPINLALEPGLAIYADSLYSGQSGFTPLPSALSTNSSTPLTAKSLALSSSIWIAASTGSPSKRVVIWDSVPDVNQLPLGSTSSLSLVDIQSSACSPPCAGSGICSVSGTCQCAPGFTGSSCESCAAGFFGPDCKPCPDNCTTCDEGITGTGRCVKPIVSNAPDKCNCTNGVCGANGQCTCNDGFTTGDDGKACSKCSAGFFLTSTGDCKICQLGCNQCEDGTGVCVACKTGFSLDPNDRTKCIPPKQATSTGQVCPDGSFGSGDSCAPCSPSCETCTGGTSNDCVVCKSGQYSFNGACVGTNGDGVCEGSTLIADNIKHECDSCGAKCTSCKIPNFNVASTVDQVQCTGCLPGFFLSGGKCVESCPSGTFVAQDNLTCTPCDSSCGTCAGSASFCLTCASNQLASNGKCVSSCPSNTFSSSGSCLTCHGDCGSCSGGAFNQCTSCSPDRPVLLNGRCLPTCSKSQFFDSTSSSCQACDSSCSSCTGAGPSNCLACSSSSQVLRGGSCVAANCQGASNVIAGLGACLSELITVPKPSGTDTPTPLPSITGLTTPTKSSSRALEWWQILLMALGCAFIFLVIIWLCRRRARKQRAKRTEMFATTPGYNRARPSGWRWRLIRFGEKLFGHRRSRRVPIVVVPTESEAVKLRTLRAAEEARGMEHEEDMVKLIGDYRYPSRAPSPQPREHQTRARVADRRPLSDASSLSAPSMYSQMTGIPRKAPEPRQPLKQKDLTSRFSASTYGVPENLPTLPSERKNPFWK